MKEIQPLEHVDAVINVPGSKSITQRALIVAALARGDSGHHLGSVLERLSCVKLTDVAGDALDQQLGVLID